MNHGIPKRLGKEPLIEALWEIRFTSEDGSVGEILPGLLYQKLRDRYPKLERLPAADIPRPIAEADPSLRYQATVRLHAPPFAVQIGAHAVSVTCAKPYSGWDAFHERIMDVATTLKATGLASKPERFSLKYVNLLDLDPPPSLALLNVELNVGGRSVEREPVHVRTELRDAECIHIIQIAAPVQAAVGQAKPVTGVLIDLDTVVVLDPGSFWENLQPRLLAARTQSKKLFFRLLTEATLARLEPEYE